MRKTQFLILWAPIDLTTEKNILGFGNVLSISKTYRMTFNLQFCCSLYIPIVSLYGVMRSSVKASSASKSLWTFLFSHNYRLGEYFVLNWSAAIFLQGNLLYELIMAFSRVKKKKKKSKLLYIFGRKPGFCHLDMSHRYENIMHHNTT